MSKNRIIALVSMLAVLLTHPSMIKLWMKNTCLMVLVKHL